MAESKADGSSVKTEDKVLIVNTGVYEQLWEFDWHVSNFLLAKSSKLVNQQKFGFVAGGGEADIQEGPITKWTCYLKETKSESDGIGIFLKLGPGSPPFLGHVAFTFEVIKPNGETCGKRSCFMEKVKEGMGKGIKDFLPGGAKSLEELIWEDGSLIVRTNFKFTICKSAEDKHKTRKVNVDKEIEEMEKRELMKRSDTIGEAIRSPFKPMTGKVVGVVSKDKISFWASSAVLSRNSPAWQEIFYPFGLKSGLEAKDRMGGYLRNISGRTLNVVLNFVMGGVLLRDEWRDKEVILELVYVAKVWGLEGLEGFLDKVLPEIEADTETIAKLAWLTKRLEFKNAAKGLREKLREKVGAEEMYQLIADTVREPLFGLGGGRNGDSGVN